MAQFRPNFTGVDENACILLKYKNGAMANLTYHTNAGEGNQNKIEESNIGLIMGQKGKIQVLETLHSFSPFIVFHFLF